jgi:hypothetical protein
LPKAAEFAALPRVAVRPAGPRQAHMSAAQTLSQKVFVDASIGFSDGCGACHSSYVLRSTDRSFLLFLRYARFAFPIPRPDEGREERR